MKKGETDLVTQVTVEDIKIQQLKSRLQRMISSLNRNIDDRESSLGLKKKGEAEIRPEKSTNSLLFQYSADHSEANRTPKLLKSQISDNSIFKRAEITDEKQHPTEHNNSNSRTDQKNPEPENSKVPEIANFSKLLIQRSNSEDGAILTFDDRFSKRSDENASQEKQDDDG